MSQNLSFDILAEAFAPIEAIGHDELTFNAGGIPVTLRVLLPEEENAVQKWAAEAMPEGNAEKKTTTDALDYLERFKIGILSHALVGVGTHDFHSADYVETGETLDNGAKVKVPRNIAMRKVLARWSGALRTRVFNKYAELLKKMELRAEKAIVYEPSDLDTEIERLDLRLQELREERERQKNAVSSGLSEQIKAMATMEDSDRQERQDTLSKFAAVRADANQKILASEAGIDPGQIDSSQLQPPRRVPIWERTSPPPPPERSEQPVADFPVQRPEGQPVPKSAEGPSVQLSDDSFVNVSDPDSLSAEVEAETQRLIVMRRKAAEQRRKMTASPETIPVSRPVSPRPPHLDAAETAADLDLDSEETRMLKEARALREKPVGTIDGTPAFKLPTEPLDRRDPGEQAPRQKVPLNPVGQGQARNPRFQPPKKI